MFNTDEKNKLLSNIVYDVDKNKQYIYANLHVDGVYKYDEVRPSLGKYKILTLEDNQNNVMQAMAVAPVNERGEETREKAVKPDMRSLVFIIN